jgi:ribosomal protein S18 acetylase RimI-like enzyme
VVAYRFCRPDDIPLLVRAVNRCYDVHFPARPPLTLDGFRRAVREAHLWPSNCMVATAGDEPVAVVIGTKQPDEVRVDRIGVSPGHQRRGHGRHLLESLGNKLAVLGPPRLVADVPVELGEAVAFFMALGWQEEPRTLAGERTAARGGLVRFITEARAA